MEKFSDIKDRISNTNPDWEWLSKIPDNSPVDTAIFSWGDEIPTKYGIPFAGNVSQLGVVLKGRVEIVEIYRFVNDYKVFRPIRIFESGDIFNDFTLVDKYVFAEDAPPSRPGEIWHVRAGATASIAVGKANNIDMYRAKIGGRKDFGVDAYLKNMFGDNENVEIAYINIDLDIISDDIKLAIIKTAWKRSYTYRASPNSFNMQSKVKFLRRVIPEFFNHAKSVGRSEKIGFDDVADVEKIGTRSKTSKRANNLIKKYPSSVNHKAIESIFYDVIYDALNRPIRDEPLFTKKRPVDNESVQVLEAEYFSNIKYDEFYFPIDLNNHFICQYFGSMCNVPHHDDPSKGQNYLTEHLTTSEILKAFGTEEPPREPEKLPHETKEGKIWKFGNGAHFWQKAAETILSEYLDDCPNGSYPFEVKVASTDDFSGQPIKDFKDRPILLLKFVRKQAAL